MAPTIAELLIRGKNILEEAGIEESEISAKAILAFVLGKNEIELHLDRDYRVETTSENQYIELINKRAVHYPLQNIIGQVDFHYVVIRVNKDVLIPRPETEILVEKTIEEIEQFGGVKVLDLGTGSGNIAIALAKAIPKLTVTAIDISPQALKVAKANARLNGVESRIDFIEADCLDDSFWSSHTCYDIIIANPPYVATAELKSLQKEITEYEPMIALVPGDDDLLFYKTICAKSTASLNVPGLIAFETGWNQAHEVKKLVLNAYPSSDVKIIKDYSDLDRIVIGRIGY